MAADDRQSRYNDSQLIDRLLAHYGFLSLRGIADILDGRISHETIRKWKRGHRGPLREEHREILLKELGEPSLKPSYSDPRPLINAFLEKYSDVASVRKVAGRVNGNISRETIRRLRTGDFDPEQLHAETLLTIREDLHASRGQSAFGDDPDNVSLNEGAREAHEDAPDEFWTMPLEELRDQAMSAGANPDRENDPETTSEKVSRSSYPRSETVHTYVLRRSDGTCEGCGQVAPFRKASSGRPYLEPHHIKQRADQGPDHPRWVIALCPNCHRRVHYGQDGSRWNKVLEERVGLIEDSA